MVAHPSNSPETWDVTTFSHPIFPATTGFRMLKDQIRTKQQSQGDANALLQSMAESLAFWSTHDVCQFLSMILQLTENTGIFPFCLSWLKLVYNAYR